MAMTTSRYAAVNVDVDSLYLYYRIHGLEEDRATNVIWERGVRRFAELFDEVGVKATFFAVASEFDRWDSARTVAEELIAAGHEIASHSWTHPYDLTRRTIDDQRQEVQHSQQVLSELRGKPVVGFRAPGYVMSDETFALLAQAGYQYDSSLFPCPPYYLAKAAVMGWMRLWGRKSASIIDKPKVMWASRKPHWKGDILEFPVSVLPALRLPFIGTSLIMMGERGYNLIRPLVRRMDFVNLEFHGIDLCDLDEDGIDPVLKKQPDLKVALAKKTLLFKKVLRELKTDWNVQPLEDLMPYYPRPQ
jgi:hypothetical protein